MHLISNWSLKTVTLLRKQWFLLIALAVYLFFTAYYIGPGLTQCTDSIYGFGDSTAGPIWRESLKPDQPLLGGYEKATNYPYGESLYSPVGYVSLVQSASISFMSDVVGPVCSYNLYNILGYLSTSLVMFGFILYITRNRWIALLAGYAVAFTPYIQSKVGGHPSYGYAAILIGILWTLLHLIRYRKKRHAILLGLLLALCAYFDPYFTLLAITVVVPVVLVWVILNISYLKKILRTLPSERKKYLAWAKPYLIAVAVFVLLLAPLVAIRIKEHSLITSSVGSVRGNVTAAAMMCSNTPVDYLLPDPRNTHLLNLFGQRYTDLNVELRNWCGFGESRVSISLTVIATLLLVGVVWLWDKLNRRTWRQRIIAHYDQRLVIWSIVAIGLTAFALGLPPYIDGIITPSGVVLKLTEMWRIFAREYLILNFAIITGLAIALAYFIKTKAFSGRRYVKLIIYVAVFVGILAEYQINAPFSPPTFSYSRDVPQVYYQIRDDKDIKALAEYPIDRMGKEHDSTVYYLTMQAVHGKSILNSAAIVDSKEAAHVAMKDLTDPQTIPALKSLGIDYVTIHGERAEDVKAKIPGIQILGENNPKVYALTMVRRDDSNRVLLARLPDVSKISSILAFEKGHVVNLELIQSPIGTEFEALQDTQLRVIALNESATQATTTQCFDVKMSAPLDESQLQVLVNDRVRADTEVTGAYIKVEVPAKTGDVITLHNSKGYNMRLNNLGCR